ncbi:hypothetical protein O3P69_012215 [Scylla paramamosain]|uniref:Uncharacterized protein n=1 Tax=Scylla paramamosain TaxID=85552 RepID=A0AAW0TCK4_SCYPA
MVYDAHTPTHLPRFMDSTASMKGAAVVGCKGTADFRPESRDADTQPPANRPHQFRIASYLQGSEDSAPYTRLNVNDTNDTSHGGVEPY